MTLSELKEFIKMERFFEKYCPSVKNVKHKLRGIDGNNNLISFTDAEKKLINKALQKFAKQIVKEFILFITLLSFYC